MTNLATAVFTLTVRVAPGADGSGVVNSASVTSATADPNGANNSGDAPVVILASAEAVLSIAKTTSSTTVAPGQTVLYSIAVANAGPSAATNVVVTDTLPAGLELVSATPTQGTCSGTTTIVCNLGSLAAGASASIALETRVIATTGTITNSATVSATESVATSDTAPPITVSALAGATAIPTLSEWMLLAMTLLLAGFAVSRMRL
jgi:uncharacterized repeat protein (TIGR01451 family)